MDRVKEIIVMTGKTPRVLNARRKRRRRNCINDNKLLPSSKRPPPVFSVIAEVWYFR